MSNIEICNLKPVSGPFQFARSGYLPEAVFGLFLLRKYETQEASDLVSSSVLDQSGHDVRSVNRGKDINGRVGSKDRGWRGSTTAFTKFSHFRRGRQFYHDWQ